MNPYATVKHKVKGRFRVGDRARLKYGWPGALAEVVEDRGPIGAGGRYYYHVRVTLDGAEDLLVDWPDEELIPLDAAAEAANGTPPAAGAG